jgi:hypothetical protein
MRVTFPAYVIHLDLITHWRGVQIMNFLYPPDTASLLGELSSSAPCVETPSICVLAFG